MREKNLALFEIEKVEKLERQDIDKHKMVLITYSFPRRPNLKAYDVFWLATPYIEKLCNFFKSIGEMKPGEKYKMNWNNLVGRRGICELAKNGLMVKRYIYFPEIIDLIQKEV